MRLLVDQLHKLEDRLREGGGLKIRSQESEIRNQESAQASGIRANSSLNPDP